MVEAQPNHSAQRYLVPDDRDFFVVYRRLRGPIQAWEEVASSEAFLALRDCVCERAHVRPDDRVVDLDVGTGLLTLALAPHDEAVTAVALWMPSAAAAESSGSSIRRDTSNGRPSRTDIHRDAHARCAHPSTRLCPLLTRLSSVSPPKLGGCLVSGGRCWPRCSR